MIHQEPDSRGFTLAIVAILSAMIGIVLVLLFQIAPQHQTRARVYVQTEKQDKRP